MSQTAAPLRATDVHRTYHLGGHDLPVTAAGERAWGNLSEIDPWEVGREEAKMRGRAGLPSYVPETRPQT